LTGRAGQSGETHSPEEWASTVVKRMSPASSIAVVCTVAISCLPSGEPAAMGGNRLEALEGDRAGQYSIRINDQWRICFEWRAGSSGPVNVEITRSRGQLLRPP
jgi:hypothetical protein